MNRDWFNDKSKDYLYPHIEQLQITLFNVLVAMDATILALFSAVLFGGVEHQLANNLLNALCSHITSL